ncbi:MAG TPA: HDOD domain-containing protein [Telluria sp.]|nr:HDOD domain-containing protein [Telluria sp.]
MINWIARWFNRPSAAEAIAARFAAQPDLPGGATQGEPAPQDDELRTLFYRWLAGAPGADVLPATEKLILDEFVRLAAAPQSASDLVPRVPAVIPQLLRSLRDDSMSGADLSRQLAQDVVLVAEVIREANGPHYRPSTPVRNIEGAIMLLGQNGMRMLLARVAFRPIISTQSGQFAHQVAPQIWRQSEACAMAASLMAPAMRVNPFEAYLAGLLHNVGLIVAVRLIDRIYTGATLPQSDQFCAALLVNARQLSARIAALWEFPVTVSSAIGLAGMPGAPPLAQLLAKAERMAMLRILVGAGRYAPDDPAVLQRLDPAAAALFDKLSDKEH